MKPIVLITFHGGCFSGGDVSFDNAQNMALEADSSVTKVIQVDFPKTWTNFKKWAHITIPEIVSMYPDSCIQVLGRSSGGYLAKWIYDNFPAICSGVYICPVWDPIKRMTLLPKFRKATLAFFSEENTVDKLQDLSINEKVYLACNDENVPNIITKDILNPIYWGPQTHKGMISCKTDAFIKDILKTCRKH